ncbi:hypothetical protein RKD34_001204 [Streptomyces sp. SAI-218]
MISGWLRTTSASRLGGAAPSQYTSTYASVRQPSADGRTVAVNPVITPVSRSRSTRRFTAVADSPIAEPISAKEVRAFAISAVTIFRSSSSNTTVLLLMSALYPAGAPTPPHVSRRTNCSYTPGSCCAPWLSTTNAPRWRNCSTS